MPTTRITPAALLRVRAALEIASKESCLAEMRASFGEVMAVLDTIPPERLTDLGVTGEWSVRDMVAHEAGVSASTVSRIINGTVNVSDGLKQAVEAAIAKFDFRPNAAARGLARGTMHTRDGVLVASIAQESLLRPTGTIPLP